MNPVASADFVENAKEVALKKVKKEHEDLLKEYLKDFEEKIKKVSEPCGHTAITYGVFKPSNMMHRANVVGFIMLLLAVTYVCNRCYRLL